MKIWPLTARHWLYTIHILFAAAWFGGALMLTVMQIALVPVDDRQLWGIDTAMKFVDDFIIIPGALGSLLTGLFISLRTKWRFFTYHWVTVKWIITVSLIVIGTFVLGPWVNGMPQISHELGLAALSDQVYAGYKFRNGIGGVAQTTVLGIAIWLSVFRPWGTREAADKKSIQA